MKQFAAIATVAQAKVHFVEKFDSAWEDRWINSEWKSGEGTQGQWERSAGEVYADEDDDMGLKTAEDSKFFSISTEFPSFTNKDQDLVIQFQLKQEKKIECGGGYLKIGPKPEDLTKFGDPTPYNIMFGPDECGFSSKRIHLILNYKGKNVLRTKDIEYKESDGLTHLYTLILKADNTYVVNVDMKERAKGKLDEDFEMLKPKKIKDPAVSKPKDWVDEKMMVDPDDKKPEDWDQPEKIIDEKATQPEDWDEEEDGEWEAPLIKNPAFKGEWKPKKIENPKYKGPWEHPMIENPDYEYDENLYAFDDFSFVGFDLWQVKGGSIFDNVLVSNDIKDADDLAKKWKKLNAVELEKKKEKEAEEKKKADEAKAKEDSKEDDLDDDFKGPNDDDEEL